MNTLPDEIVLEIISYLSNHSLQEFMKSSKTNCELCQVVWKRKYEGVVDKNPLIGFYKDLLGETKLVYYYRKYSRGLKKHLVDSLKPKMNRVTQVGISHREKITLVYEAFDLYVKFKDIFLNHKSLTRLVESVQNKLHGFIFETKTDYGSQQAREIAHKYYPLLFPEIYHLILLMGSKHSNTKIRSKYGIKDDFCIFANLLCINNSNKF